MAIRVFTAFSGYDSQCMALDMLKRQFPDFDYELVGWSEIDSNAIMAHNAVYPQWADRNAGDITKIDWGGQPDFDLFTYSFPCGLSGTMVKTLNGYKTIESIQVGELVATHNNRYKEVIRTMSRYCNEHYTIKAVGCELHLTSEHPLWVLRNGKEQWVKVKDLKTSDYISYCIPDGNKRVSLTDEYLWLLGRYVADGFINKYLYNSVEFAIGYHKEDYFLRHIPSELKNKFRKFNKSCIEYRIADKELQCLCRQFGNGAKNKCIPQWIIDMPKEQIDVFLDGYFSGDGHLRYKGDTPVQMFSTVSKELFLGIQLLLLKSYNKICSLNIRHDNRKDTFNDTYNGQIAFSNKDLQKRIGFRFFAPIRKINKIDGDVQVYNLEVADDNSYTCDNVNTHNCTDISSAGLQKGLSADSGTRSSLLWECEKAIRIKRPKYLLMENVSALVTQKFIGEYHKWLNILERYGYSNFGKVMNAKDYGIPQNRERIFLVSILGEEDFCFPNEIPLELRLKDLIEDEVDDKYVLSDKIIDGFLEHNRKHKEKGTGFIFVPKDVESDGGGRTANCLRAKAAIAPTDNVIKERKYED